MEEVRENDSAEEKDQYSNPRSILKPALITLAIVAVVVVIVFLIMIAPGEESVPDFLKRWEKVVESGSQKAYEQICSDNFKEKSKELYEETKKLI